MFDHHNVLQCNHNIISMIVSTFCSYLTYNTLLNFIKALKLVGGQVCDNRYINSLKGSKVIYLNGKLQMCKHSIHFA
jgi:hypothetical protein